MLIPKRLAEFGDMFKLPIEKDVMPYALYTKENVEKGICKIAEAERVFRKTDKEEDIQ